MFSVFFVDCAPYIATMYQFIKLLLHGSGVCRSSIESDLVDACLWANGATWWPDTKEYPHVMLGRGEKVTRTRSLAMLGRSPTPQSSIKRAYVSALLRSKQATSTGERNEALGGDRCDFF